MSVNKVILIGNVGRDAEVRHTKSGTAVGTFSLATSEKFDKKDGSGEKDEKTQWHNVVVWGRLAEVAGQYVKKGRQLYIEGRLNYNTWKDDKGVDHYRTEVVANYFELLGRKGDGDSGYQPGGGEYQRGGSGSGGGSRSSGGGQGGGAGAGGNLDWDSSDEFDVGDLGPPLDMDDNPLSPRE